MVDRSQAQVKVNGTWRQWKAAFVKVTGSWRPIKQAWVKANGTWRPVYMNLTEIELPGGTNINLETWLASKGVTGGDVEITVTGRVNSATVSPALRTGNLGRFGNVKLIINSRAEIGGMGGKGGDGRSSSAATGINGSPGGTALQADSAITVLNNGAIAGGGGGGGGGGYTYGQVGVGGGWVSESRWQTQAAGGGGGGGAGTIGGEGGVGSSVPNLDTTRPIRFNRPSADGAAGTNGNGAGGNGGGGGSYHNGNSGSYLTSYGGNGGNGGRLGQPGSAGTRGRNNYDDIRRNAQWDNVYDGGVAGAAGRAVSGDSNINWEKVGVIIGPRV